MKRHGIGAAAAVFAAVLLLTGCSAPAPVVEAPEAESAVAVEDAGTAESVTQEEPEEEVPTGLEERPEEAAPEITELPVSPGSAGIPQVVLRRKSETYAPSDNYEHRAYVDCDTIALTEASALAYPALEKTLQALSEERAERSQQMYMDLQTSLGDLLNEDIEITSPLYEENYLYVRRADAQAFSLCEAGESYSGGIHGYHWKQGYSFDAKTGEEIALSELVSDDVALREALIVELNRAYPDGYWLFELEEILGKYEIDPPEQSEEEQEDYENVRYGYNWILEPQGVTFFFNPYDIAPYAAGAQEVILLFDKYPELFSEKYGKTEGAFTKYFGEWDSVKMDLDADAEADEIIVYGERDEHAVITDFHVLIDGNEYIDHSWDSIYSVVPAILRTDDGRTWLYATVTSDNDWQETCVYEIGGKSVTPVGSVPGGISTGLPFREEDYYSGYPYAQITDPGDFFMRSRTHLLGTMPCMQSCRVGADGLPAAKTDFYEIAEERELTLKQDLELPAVTLQADGTITETGESYKLAAGEVVCPIRTDSETWTDLETADGRQVRAGVERGEDGWPQTVNGVEVEDLFEGMMFSG